MSEQTANAPRSWAHRWPLHLLLFVGTLTSVFYAGALGVLNPNEEFSWLRLLDGKWFALPLMAILLAHEFGHFFAARYHGVSASLPYFLPMPWSPFGTWGAIIAMPSRIASRRALLDIGAAGPLAGMVVAIPVLVIGLSWSEVKQLDEHALLEGQCLLYWLIKLVMKTIRPGEDVFLHPMAFAGWAGLFVTMINLLPFGQLDGGHVAYALLGDRQNRLAQWIRRALIPLFLYNIGSNFYAAHRAGFSSDELVKAASNSLFWLLWFGILTAMQWLTGADHPPVDDQQEPLGTTRTAIAVLCLVLFVLLFMPAPFTQTLQANELHMIFDHAPKLLMLAMTMAAGLAACGEGCKSSNNQPATGVTAPSLKEPPTVRIYALSTLAGALEPCGCSKNQLGGFDHFASYVASQRSYAKHDMVLAAGPLFFMDPTPKSEHAQQDIWKAEAMAEVFSKVGLTAWAPGLNDWQGGAKTLADLKAKSKAELLAANLEGEHGGAVATSVKVVNGVKVGLVGLSTPAKMGQGPTGVKIAPPPQVVTKAINDLKAQGAQVLVGVFALPRGEALRLAETTATDLHVLLLGKPFDQGETNDKPSPPMMLGKTLVVESANHLQTVGVIDLYVRDGSFEFQDAAGIAKIEERTVLQSRAEELASKIRRWEQNPAIDAKDLQARKAEHQKVLEEIRKLETPTPPTKGSFFRYSSQPIVTSLGKDANVQQSMLQFYGRVNEHNKAAYANKEPPPPGADGNRYVGVEVCSSCHPQARVVWNSTQHSRAYKTLVDGKKEYNFDCVSCHVTGYEKPGGSNITKNELLQNVQCEECHGSGALHSQTPTKTNIVTKITPETCVASCHHPPHVDDFDAVAQMHKILGPGHGKVEEWPPLKAK